MRVHIGVALLAVTVAALLAAPAFTRSTLSLNNPVTITNGKCVLGYTSVSHRNTRIVFHIINNGSVAARRAGYSTSMIYGAAKAAVNHLTVCAAMQLGEKGVRCNSISPGGIATGIFAKALGLAPDKADAYAEAMKASMAKNQPIPRAGITDDIAHAAVFLASDASSFINGHDLVVDGGLVGGRMWTPHQEGVKAMRQAFGVDEV